MPTRAQRHRPPGHQQARKADARQHDRERNREPHRLMLWTARYRLFRKTVLWAHPVCVRCKVRASVDVHHVRGLALHPEDLCDGEQVAALCHPCHARLTAQGG